MDARKAAMAAEVEGVPVDGSRVKVRSWNRDWSAPGVSSNSSTDRRSRSLATRTDGPTMVAASSSVDLPGVAVRKTRPGATRVPGVEARSRQLRMLP